jgi:hypothetical protein
VYQEEAAMTNDYRPKSDAPPRMPLRFEFHYEVDDRGETYRVWEEQLHEPIGLGGDLGHLERRVSPDA